MKFQVVLWWGKKVKKNVIYKSLENPSEKSNKSKKYENVNNHEFQSFPIK